MSAMNAWRAHALWRGLFLLAFLLATLLAPALAIAKTYKGPETPKPGMAVLNGELKRVEDMYGKGIYGYIGVRMAVVDGDRRGGINAYTNTHPTSVHLAPGRHTVRLMYTDALSYSYTDVWFDAEADQAYTARYEFKDGTLRCWIEETATHRAVGGFGDGTEPAVTASESEESIAEPPPVPDADSAVLVSDPFDAPPSRWREWKGKNTIKEVRVLDGKRKRYSGSGYQAFRLVPGQHTLEVIYGVGSGSAIVKLAFALEANRTYWLRRTTEGYETRFRVEEAGSGKTVSEVVP